MCMIVYDTKRLLHGRFDFTNLNFIFFRFLAKPFSVAQICTAVEDVLKAR